MKKKKHKPGMLAQKPSKGLERDSHGSLIPVENRLPEDRQKTKRASGTGKKAKKPGKAKSRVRG